MARPAREPSDVPALERTQDMAMHTPVVVPMDARTRELARVAFEAYSAAVLGRAVSGDRIPAWDDVGERVRRGWCAAAGAVRTEYDKTR